MGQKRFTAEFKDEAVRQVTERGHPVTEVAVRLGVSSHSLYKWVKAVRPSKGEERSDELLETKKEVLRLRAALRRVEEERDTPKRAAAYVAKQPKQSTPSSMPSVTGSRSSRCAECSASRGAASNVTPTLGPFTVPVLLRCGPRMMRPTLVSSFGMRPSGG